jgi:hypothetical protein
MIYLAAIFFIVLWGTFCWRVGYKACQADMREKEIERLKEEIQNNKDHSKENSI